MYHVALGNHDYMSSVTAQVAYSQVNSAWDMPHEYYRRVHVKLGVTVCLIVIDTINWNSDQADWVETQLGTPECDTKVSWTIVAGHYPIWSSANYSDDDNLKSQLLPLLHQYNVQLYMCGHEHLHGIFYDGSLIQVISGAVAETRAAIQFKPHAEQIWGVSGTDIIGYLKLSASYDSIGVRITSARSDWDFQTFNLTRDGTRESMFGHISWSYQNSNADASVAHLPQAHSQSIETTTTSTTSSTATSSIPDSTTTTSTETPTNSIQEARTDTSESSNGTTDTSSQSSGTSTFTTQQPTTLPTGSAFVLSSTTSANADAPITSEMSTTSSFQGLPTSASGRFCLQLTTLLLIVSVGL